MFAGGVALAAEHAGEFGHAGGAVEAVDLGDGAVAFQQFGDDVMGVGGGGHLGKVGDAEDLAFGGDLLHFFADGIRGLAADIGIDFIEDEDGNLIGGGEDGLEGEHHAGHFAGGGDGAEGADGFAGIGGELEFHGVETGGRGGGGGREGDFEEALLEAEVGELADGGLGERGNELFARGGELFAGGGDFGIGLVEGGVEAGDFGIAGFEGTEFLGGLVAKGDDFGEGGTVFALEGMEEIEAFLKLGEAGGVKVHAIGIAGQSDLEVAPGFGGLHMEVEQFGGTGIDALEFGEQAADDAGLGDEGVFVLRKGFKGGLAELEEFGGVAGAVKLLGDRFFLVGFQAGGGDLLDLEAEQVELLGEGLLNDDEGGFFGFQVFATADEGAEGGGVFFEAAEGIEDEELAGGMEQ